ncbi:MAG: toll/interleukin-1 receptor domain-containing protein, partial [Chloroflexota bacterium]
MSQVFISYQHNAYTFVADDLVKRIEKEKFTVWWDDQIPVGHEDWRQKIDAEIENARIMVVVVTPEAVASQYVTYEWSYALGKNKIVIPLTYQKTPVHPRLLT